MYNLDKITWEELDALIDKSIQNDTMAWKVFLMIDGREKFLETYRDKILDVDSIT